MLEHTLSALGQLVSDPGLQQQYQILRYLWKGGLRS